MNLASTLNQVRDADIDAILGRASRTLPQWVAAVFAIVIAFQLARLVWLLIPSPAEDPAATAVRAGQPTATGNTLIDVTGIVEAHFFGKADPQANVIATPLDDVPESNAALSLRGTIAANEPGQAIAIIADGSGSEKIYKIDDALPGGLSLHAVQPDRVILNRAGQLEALLLPREAEMAGTPARQYVRPTQVPQPVQQAPSVRELVTENADTLTDIIRPQPVFANGKQRGYRIYPGRKRDAFAELGLKPGDLVTEINGTTLDDPASGMEVFRSLGDAAQVSVTVERDGQPEVLTLDTSQISSESSDEVGFEQ
ncbi:MAG: type II secretion system protein GspC [Gammaproteobacteria bacterium]|nr:type II secretion system protein GspC [Gammaproteobacteria bacterium]